jgi:hypothetical protein
LKLESSQTVDPELSKLVGDFRYSVRCREPGKGVNMALFLEHQSSPDKSMGFRILEYVVSLYRELFLLLEKGEKFPYPLAVVLHHGPKPWKGTLSMREWIAVPDGAPEEILHIPICLVDLAAMPLESLPGHPMIRAMLNSLQSASMKMLSPERMRGILAGLGGLGGDRRLDSWVRSLGNYYVNVRGQGEDFVGDMKFALSDLYPKKEAEKMAMTMYDQVVEIGMKKGKAEGLAEGEAKGLAEGEAKGKAEGLAEGETKGKIESTMTLLTIRFGDIPASLRKKLESAHDGERIKELFTLAATCRSLKEFQKGM